MPAVIGRVNNVIGNGRTHSPPPWSSIMGGHLVMGHIWRGPRRAISISIRSFGFPLMALFPLICHIKGK